MLEMTTPSPFSLTNALAKLWLPPSPIPRKAWKRTVLTPCTERCKRFSTVARYFPISERKAVSDFVSRSSERIVSSSDCVLPPRSILLMRRSSRIFHIASITTTNSRPPMRYSRLIVITVGLYNITGPFARVCLTNDFVLPSAYRSARAREQHHYCDYH